MVHDFLLETGILDAPRIKTIRPEPVPDDLLRKAHSEHYIQKVRQISETGKGDIDIDTPGFIGILENSLLASGTIISGIRAMHEGRIDHFYSPTGGFHHAFYDHGGGFCIFNDIAMGVILLKELGYERILIADFDVHHGNGTQDYFYDDPDVMTISFHEDPDWMYPHDGFIEDIGASSGKGYNINMPFPMDAGDDVYRYAFDQLVPPLVQFFSPDFILFLPSFDAHYRDPLAHLNLTFNTIHYVANWFHEFSHRNCDGCLGVVSGGGYNPEVFKEGAKVIVSLLAGLDLPIPDEEPPFRDDEELWQITRENVEKAKKCVFSALSLEY
jgi:acetoin utilization protein AcuC